MVRLAKEHDDFVHISIGEILRSEIENGSNDDELISNSMKEGGILPFDFIWGLVDREMKKAGLTK